jgi:serine/threonine protein kinase
MEERIAKLLDDYVARQQRGEKPTAEDYRLSAGALWADFAQLVEAESSFDEALAEEEGDLPREFGAYTLLRELGRGATGVVYEARRGGRTVALKVLRPGFDTSPDAIARFRREAEACTRVRHDHVVEVYEAGEAEGRPFYAMTFLDGRSLSAVSRAGGLPEPRELARRIARVADALHAIHGAGVVHRDVKPGNIMADSKGRMVLADFGLARSAGTATLTKTGEALGTPLFMAPEQLLGDRARIDGRSDVYGLGATLYDLLTGRPLFGATDWRRSRCTRWRRPCRSSSRAS